ncbi:hypothetical protein OC835_008002, partial [Tilletia horrida]
MAGLGLNPQTCDGRDLASAHKRPRTVGEIAIGSQPPLVQQDRKPPDRPRYDGVDGTLTVVENRRDAIDDGQNARRGGGSTLARAESRNGILSSIIEQCSACAQGQPASPSNVHSSGNMRSPDRSATATRGWRRGRQQAQEEEGDTGGLCHIHQQERQDGGDDACESCRMWHRVGIDSEPTEDAQIATAVHGPHASVIMFGDMSFRSDGRRANLGDAIDFCFSLTTSGSEQQPPTSSASRAVGTRPVAGPRPQRIQFGDLPPVVVSVKPSITRQRKSINGLDGSDPHHAARQRVTNHDSTVEVPTQHRPEVAQLARARSQECLPSLTGERPIGVADGRHEDAVPPDKQPSAPARIEGAVAPTSAGSPALLAYRSTIIEDPCPSARLQNIAESCNEQAVPPDNRPCVSVHAEAAYTAAPLSAGGPVPLTDQGASTSPSSSAIRAIVISSRTLGTTFRLLV